MSGFYTVTEIAKILGISTVAVRKQIIKHQMKAIRIGRNYAIPKAYVDEILGKTLSADQKKMIDAAVKKTVAQYGEVLKRLGHE
jgi:excisionase family DNA binding protein